MELGKTNNVATSIKTLKEHGIIRNVDYKEVEKKKVDGIIVLRKSVIAVIEYKKPSEFKAKKQQDKAITQEIEVAKAIGIKHKIEPILRGLAKGRKGEKGEDEFTKVYPSMIEDVEILMPINNTGRLDIYAQHEIVEKVQVIDDINEKVKEYKKRMSGLTINFEHEYEFAKFQLKDLFEICSGNSKLTKDFLNSNKGKYVVYSANTKENGILGYINTYDHEVECIQITTNGVYAGTLFYRPKHKFSINGDARLLIKKSEQLNYTYLSYEIKKTFSKYGFNWENKPTVSKIRNIEIAIPVNNHGDFDFAVQEKIAENHQKIENIKSLINQELDKITEVNINLE